MLYFVIGSFHTDTEVSIYDGLFHFNPVTPCEAGGIGSSLAVFHARRIVQPIFPYNRFEPENGLISKGYVKAYLNAVMLIAAILFLCRLHYSVSTLIYATSETGDISMSIISPIFLIRRLLTSESKPLSDETLDLNPHHVTGF